MALEVGEKYLRVKYPGMEAINVFKNNTKVGNQPDYTAYGVSVWICEKKADTSQKDEGLQ